MDSLESSVESKIPLEGCTLVGREKKQDVVHERFKLEPEEYNAAFGFRQFGQHDLETRFLSEVIGRTAIVDF